MTTEPSDESVERRMARELAPQLDDLIAGTLHPHDGLRKSKTAELHEWLWDNKVGILRCLQALAALASLGRVPQRLCHPLDQYCNWPECQCWLTPAENTAARDSTALAPARDGWRDISTAPKYRVIIGYSPRWGVETMIYKASQPPAGWYAAGYMGEATRDPTHWRELPTPPSQVPTPTAPTDPAAPSPGGAERG